MRPLAVRHLGVVPYPEALALMQSLVDERAADRVPDTLLVLSHPPVITVGRKRGAREDVLISGDIPVFEVERGGETTYHGPGQIVLYPVLALEGPERDLHKVLRDLEETAIQGVKTFGVTATRRQGLTGAWVDDRKIASIGIAVKRWITYHGLALNLDPDPAFRTIRACGQDSRVISCLNDVSAGPISREEAVKALVGAFIAVFQRG